MTGYRQCDAQTLISDGFWGTATRRCDLILGHDGDHAVYLEHATGRVVTRASLMHWWPR